MSFASLLVESWRGEGMERITPMFKLIGSDKLKPEFEIPEDPEKLAQWLDISIDDDIVRRQIRSKLRAIAKDTSETYLSGNLSLNI